MFRILHLSDIHIGKTYKEPNSIACKIASDIDHNGLGSINNIIVTGDIFDGKAKLTDSLINTAVSYFDVLLNEINNNQEEKQISKEDIIFVPGNHDLIRVDNLTERWSKYRNFLYKFYGYIPSFYNENNYSVFKEYKEYKIAFIGFNSCEIEKRNLFDNNYIDKFYRYIDDRKLHEYGIDKTKVVEVMKSEIANEYDDYGYIPLSQITPIERKVKNLDDYTIVALFHHHFYLFPEVAYQFGDSSLIRNYSEVIQHLKYMNVNVVLHGHKHFDLERPYITDDYYETSEDTIDVFAGGSVGTDRKEQHTFGVLDLYEKKDDIKLKHYKFVYNGEKLEPISKKQVPPQKLSCKIVKIIDIFKALSPEQYELYEDASEKSFKSYDSCNKIISWVSEAITGFTEVYKYLEQDYNNILFLLYAINYRTISYMKIVGNENSYFESSSKTWNSFYDKCLHKSDFVIPKNDYIGLFEIKKLKSLATYCDKLLNLCTNKKSKVYLAFTMLGVFFSDLYLVLTKYADDFKESIKYKVNIKIEENKFHENVPAPRIIVKSDADRRSVYIDLLCNEATAHKMAVLFVKEFDLLINKFEDYFKIIGLKIYYLLPKINKDRMKNTLDNYNFEAYIPTLIPLLTGDNIYSSKVVFARELIQNSIDAISVREAKDKNTFTKEILIELKTDENGKKYFKIVDRGTGMDRYKIERYFTSIGRSFYSGEEYEDLNISYKPISNFGIGFLSSFMVCKEIDVKTKYYMENSEGLKLHIPNYDGCFFIERDEQISIGTEIKLYLDNSLDNEDIVDYISTIMKDIKYDIKIKYLDEHGKEKKIDLPAYAVRKECENSEFKFFVPFLDDGNIGEIHYCNDILNNEYIKKYDFGILIYNNMNPEYANNTILNSGIAIKEVSLSDLFGTKSRHSFGFSHSIFDSRNKHTNIIVNFPSNWLQLDVARDNITSFSEIYNKDFIEVKIADSLYNQLLEYINTTKGNKSNVPAICLQEVIEYALEFIEGQNSNAELKKKLIELKYTLVVEFNDIGLCYKISRKSNHSEKIKIVYSSKSARTKRQKWLERLNFQNVQKNKSIRYYNDSTHSVHKERTIDLVENFMIHSNINLTDEINYKLRQLMREYSEVLNNNDEKNILRFMSTLLLKNTDVVISKSSKQHASDFGSLLENAFLNYFYIGSEETQEIIISYEELKKVFGIEIIEC